MPRENARTIVPAARKMIQKVNAAPRSLWILTAAIVETEWEDNVEKVNGESSTHIANVDRNLLKLEDAISSVSSSVLSITSGQLKQFPKTSPRYVDLELPRQLREIAEEIFAASIWVAPDDDIFRAAHTRSTAALKPAAVGKRERPDCQIIETYFALCRRLRAGSFDFPCVFVSSNKADFYGEGSPLRPHEDLAGECANLDCNSHWTSVTHFRCSDSCGHLTIATLRD